ncbi:MAG: Rrf2 family transcriptional regulator [Deltaproteobacteria bacterium]|nr:Rrf2 family transcriptional regulator [Deltaproteobacteria bacterium]
MKISTRTRYGVRLMIALARNYGQGMVFLKDIAAEEAISEKYLSQIIIPLRSMGLVVSTRGAYGGYRLAKPPVEITLKDIIEVIEGLQIIDCLKNSTACERISVCPTREVWQELSDKIAETLASFSLDELAQTGTEKMKNATKQKS